MPLARMAEPSEATYAHLSDAVGEAGVRLAAFVEPVEPRPPGATAGHEQAENSPRVSASGPNLTVANDRG